MKNPEEHQLLADVYLATEIRAEVEGRWLLARDAAATLGTIHVLTAWNPGTERPAKAVNDAANEMLRQLLVAEGFMPIPAIGCDPKSAHSEESWCVVGLNDDRAREIGARFGQWAVFRITPGEQAVLGCFGDWTRCRPLG